MKIASFEWYRRKIKMNFKSVGIIYSRVIDEQTSF